MRIKKVSIDSIAPLPNIEVNFSQVGLIIGDNERGKSRFLNVLSDLLFSKNTATTWEGQSFASRYDAPRLKNLCVFRNDEFPRHGSVDWNKELRSLIFSNDMVSEKLQMGFIKSLGTSGKEPWLDQLHASVQQLNLALNDALPQAINREQELSRLKEEKQRLDENEENLFPLMVKTRMGREFLELYDNYEELEEKIRHFDEESFQNIDTLDKEIGEYEQKVAEKRKKIDGINNNLISWDNFSPFKHNSILFLFGLIFVGSALLTVWWGINLPTFHPVKIFSVFLFGVGGFFVMKALNSELLKSKDAEAYHARRKAEVLEKEHEALTSLEKELFALRTEYRTLLEARRRMPSIEEKRIWEKESGSIFAEIKEKEPKIQVLFGTTKPQEIAQIVGESERNLEDSQLMDFYKEYNEGKVQESLTPKSAFRIESVREAFKKTSDLVRLTPAKHRYPEILAWEMGETIDHLEKLADQSDIFLEKLAKDRYYCQKITETYKNWETGGEEFLVFVSKGESFRQLVQYVFGGKYKTFDISLDEDDKIIVHARTGKDELIPIEELSTTAGMQFYFVLKLAIIRQSLLEEPGIVLLDDAFSAFDTIRTRLFIDILEALVQEGWQIIYTMKDDKLIWDELHSRFAHLTVINLNKENVA
ncbi:MAG: ATP-binding protein [Brevinema sp.]